MTQSEYKELIRDLNCNIRFLSLDLYNLSFVSNNILIDRLKDSKELLLDISNNKRDSNYSGEIKIKSEILEKVTQTYINKINSILNERNRIR